MLISRLAGEDSSWVVCKIPDTFASAAMTSARYDRLSFIQPIGGSGIREDEVGSCLRCFG